MLFTDGSVNPRLRVGYGAYLARSERFGSLNSMADNIRLKLFVETSSTKLELQTLLWALSEISAAQIVSYTDSQNIAALNSRRKKLEGNDYFAKNGKRLKNHKLYRQFYKFADDFNITFVKVKGHAPSSEKSDIERLFSLVDRASRNALRAYSSSLQSGMNTQE